ncbi:putative mannosyltransferase [Venturia nashicola]|uniref:Putative mannosyltransferase n=1 Tax=Venturia nashicola TaxID=86259 RepID=A0A4Z1P2B5_9PEZI|nr:putative mannosyltransferase [Venturia nashicola]
MASVFTTLKGFLFPPASLPQAASPLVINETTYRYDTTSSATHNLPDGRKLGYAQYGLLTGKPIFYMHGLPGSRMEAAILDDTAKEMGARIIAVERPGCGLSDPCPGWTIREFPRDVESLAASLGVREFGVLGLSGGGPAVLACAAYFPKEQLKCASLVSALGPPDIGYAGLPWLQRSGLAIGYPYLPRLTTWWFKQQATGRLDLSDEDRLVLLTKVCRENTKHPKDIPIFLNENFLQLQIVTAKAAFAQGIRHAVHDGTISCTSWGFKLEDIREDLAVQIWCGTDDTSVPFNHGVQMKERMKGKDVVLTVGEDETHASMEINYMSDYLEGIVGFLQVYK